MLGVRRPEWVVGLAVLVCLPMVPGILSGAVDPESALVRFLVALIGSAVAGSVLGAMWRGYSEHARRARIEDLLAPRSRPATGATKDPSEAGGAVLRNPAGDTPARGPESPGGVARGGPSPGSP